MIELLASHGATWEIHMHPGDGLTYADIVATGLRRSMPILAHYGDLDTASAMLADNPALADNEEALKTAASGGREDFVRLLLRYQPDLASRVTVSRPREMAKLLFEHGMNPTRPNWLRITPLHDFAETGDVESAALGFLTSDELTARAVTLREFVRPFYRGLLARDPDPSGQAAWEGALGDTLAAVVRSVFLRSAEFEARRAWACGS
jgi:hypothetical protein